MLSDVNKILCHLVKETMAQMTQIFTVVNIIFIDIKDRGSLQVSKINITSLQMSKIKIAR
jgi:hypothetical protein